VYNPQLSQYRRAQGCRHRRGHARSARRHDQKDAWRLPTGVVRGAAAVAFVAAKIPLPDRQQWVANARKFVSS